MSEQQSSDYYREFNEFQTAFYTNKSKFKNYSKYEIKKYGYVLLNNLGKGFPHLANIIINLKGFGWKANESLEVLRALQSQLYNNRLPDFIYFKSEKSSKTKEKAKKDKNGLLIFDSEIQFEIQSILFMDSKTYDYLKFTDKIQFLGKQLLGEFQQKEKLKQKRIKK